jgi:hypothetical protein
VAESPTPAAAAPVEGSRPEAASDQVPSTAAADLARLGQLWPAVLDALRGLASGPTASYFDGTRPVDMEGDRLTVGFPPGSQFNRRNAEKPERRSQLSDALKSVTGEDFQLEYGELGSAEGEPSGDAAPAAVDEEKLVERVKSEFNAEEVI